MLNAGAFPHLVISQLESTHDHEDIGDLISCIGEVGSRDTATGGLKMILDRTAAPCVGT